MEKKCTRCGQVKDEMEFYKDKTHKDGRKCWCIACYLKKRFCVCGTRLGTGEHLCPKCRRSNKKIRVCLRDMKARCYNENHPRYCQYGGRGIIVCDAWFTFSNFKEWALSSGYNDDMTIDRIDNNKGYNPENCQWLTKSEHSIKTNKEKHCVCVT